MSKEIIRQETEYWDNNKIKQARWTQLGWGCLGLGRGRSSEDGEMGRDGSDEKEQ